MIRYLEKPLVLPAIRPAETRPLLAQHDGLVPAAAKVARMLVGDPTGEIVGIGVLPAIHVADVTDAANDAASAEPRHHQHLAAKNTALDLRIIDRHRRAPAHDRGERSTLAVRLARDPPFDARASPFAAASVSCAAGSCRACGP